MKTTSTVRFIARGGVLAAISLVLFMPIFELPLPFMPPWLKLDFSSVPVLLAGFAMGPLGGLMVQAVKSAAHVAWSTSGGVGEIADFLMGAALMLPAALIYAKNRTRKGAFLGLLAGLVCFLAMGVASNYYILLPMYTKTMSMNDVIAAAASKNTLIQDVGGYLVYGVLPFNLVKGALVSLVTLLLYKKVSPILHDRK